MLRGGDSLPARIEALDAFTDGWLRNRRLSEHTREAYRRDVGGGWTGAGSASSTR